MRTAVTQCVAFDITLGVRVKGEQKRKNVLAITAIGCEPI
jgi:hypothetical protein